MRKVFLTGASSGIGLATAELLTRHQFEVWGTSRSLPRLPQLQGFHAVELDLGTIDSVREGYGRALAQAGSFDVVINNAGSGHYAPAETLSSEIVGQQMQVLFLAQVELCRLALQQMRPAHQGVIINITSLATRLPVPFMSAYNAAKSALAAFTMSLQLETEGSGIRIIDVQPGDIRTGFNEAVVRGDDVPQAGLGRAWELIEKNMRNAPPPSVVADAILSLLQDPTPAPRVTVGDFFQGSVAPVLNRFLPQRARLWAIRKYYGI